MRDLIFITFLIYSVFAFPLSAKEILQINTGDSAPLHQSDHAGFIDVVLKEAFQRIGIQITINKLPAERSLLNANMGINDGDSDRIAGLEKIYPNLVPVPEKIMDWEFVAFSKNNNIKLLNWNALKPYSVSYITGWKIFEHNANNGAEVTPVKDINQLFDLLNNNRTDIALYEKWQGLTYVRQKGLQAVFTIEPALAKKEKFLYLHKKHLKIVPQVSEALRTMKADGSYQRIYQKILAPLLITNLNDE